MTGPSVFLKICLCIRLLVHTVLYTENGKKSINSRVALSTKNDVQPHASPVAVVDSSIVTKIFLGEVTLEKKSWFYS